MPVMVFQRSTTLPARLTLSKLSKFVKVIIFHTILRNNLWMMCIYISSHSTVLFSFFQCSFLCVSCKCHIKWPWDSWKSSRKWYNGARKFCILTFPQTCWSLRVRVAGKTKIFDLILFFLILAYVLEALTFCSFIKGKERGELKINK